MQINLIEQKIIITKDTILGANKSFFSQNKLSPEILKKIIFNQHANTECD